MSAAGKSTFRSRKNYGNSLTENRKSNLLPPEKRSRATPDQHAISWVDAHQEGPRWTWRQLARYAAGAAWALAAYGIGAQHRVAVIGGNTPEWIVLREAVRLRGATFIPISPKITAEERDFLLRNSEAALAVGPPDMPAGELAVEDWSAFYGREADEPPQLNDAPQPQQLLYTSGSGGVPKGVLRSRGSDLARMQMSIQQYGLSADMRHLVAGPLYHSGPSIFYRMFLLLGAPQQMLRRFDAKRVLELILSEQVDALFMVPTMWRMLLDAEGGHRRPWPLKRAWIAGSRTEPELRLELLDRLPEDALWEFYGATETGTIAVLPPEAQRSHMDTVGFPAPGVEIRIVDETGQDVAPGATGRIYVKSPSLMTGYHRGPGTPADLSEDRLEGGWVSVGDRGSFTADGALKLIGREKGMIISGGVNIYPEEVEQAIKKIDGVLEAVVFGIPDPIWGQRICAIVEPASEATLTADDVRRALEGHLAHFKIPKQIRIAPIPRTASEKVRRDAAQLARLL
ncbi:MAG: hypothetical protein D6761_08220 [Candidatus Dadabacteria bacterium]|nr:MAG: hypothetical protein D6761_08220 [Candidatus Dadabacteria bacterium]